METWEIKARERVHIDKELQRIMNQLIVTYWGGCRDRAAVAFDEFAEKGD